MSKNVIIDFAEFEEHNLIIKNLWFVERRFFFWKKYITRDIYFEGVSIQTKKNFENKYLKADIKGNVLLKPTELVDDLYNFLKKDERNFWLKKEYLKQQTIEKLQGIVLIICTALYESKKKILKLEKEEVKSMFLNRFSISRVVVIHGFG